MDGTAVEFSGALESLQAAAWRAPLPLDCGDRMIGQLSFDSHQLSIKGEMLLSNGN